MANRVWLGVQSGNFRFRISKPGVNVLTASESQLMFSENYKGWQWVQTGTVTFPNAGGIQTQTINFANRGIVPYVVFYRCGSATTDWFDPGPWAGVAGLNEFDSTRTIDITATSCTFEVVGANDGGRYVRYLLIFGSLA